jgi:hypothetical protein
MTIASQIARSGYFPFALKPDLDDGAAAIDLLFANVSATLTIGLSNCVSSQLLGLSCRVDLRPRAKWPGGPRSSSSVCVLRLWQIES